MQYGSHQVTVVPFLCWMLMACQAQLATTDDVEPNEDDPAGDEEREEDAWEGQAVAPNTAGGGTPIVTHDAGSPTPREEIPALDAAAPDAFLAPAGYVRTAVGVGYGGIRITSFDGGRTWSKTGEVEANGGDDTNLIRAVTWGKNLWIAGGWGKWWVSATGRDWQMKPHKFGIIQGMAFGNDIFMATEMDGRVHTSRDGETWTTLGNVGVGNHARLVFGNGLFAASGDSGATMTSKDGVSWQRLSVPNVVAFCDGQFKSNRDCYGETYNAGIWTEGLWLKIGGGGVLFSETGQKWVLAHRLVGNAIDDLAVGWSRQP